MSDRQKDNILIAVAWPYVNGVLHVGHLAGYLLPADIAARYHRLVGRKVLMVSGSDCYGTPTTIEADKRGKTPQEIVEEYHAKDADLFLNTLHLSYDLYTRTDNPTHQQITQDFFVKHLEEGYITIDTQQQYYSPSQHRFLPDRYIQGTCPNCGFKEARSDQCDNCGKLLEQGDVIDPISKLTNDPVELRETEHYFMDWPKLQPKIEAYVKAASGNWKEWVRQEALGWLQEGLRPRAITRDLDWGVPIPADRIPENMRIEHLDQKRIYVWYDAVIGYYSASLLWSQMNNDSWEPFWKGEDTKHYYFMGKDNLVFHTIFWPGQLMTFDSTLHLPDQVSINMFLNLEGKQFSKSRGVSIDIDYIVKKYSNDAVRFYLTYVMPEKKDSSFSWLDFQERVNSTLIGTLGNYIHRVMSISKGLTTETLLSKPLDSETEEAIATAFSSARLALEECEFRQYLDSVLQLASLGNRRVDYGKIWELKKTSPDELNQHLINLYAIILALGILLKPLLPDASDRLMSQLSLSPTMQWPKPDQELNEIKKLISQATLPAKPTPVFDKISDEMIAAELGTAEN